MEPMMIKIIIALRLRTVVLRLTSVCLKIILIMSVSSFSIFRFASRQSGRILFQLIPVAYKFTLTNVQFIRRIGIQCPLNALNSFGNIFD